MTDGVLAIRQNVTHGVLTIRKTVTDGVLTIRQNRDGRGAND